MTDETPQDLDTETEELSEEEMIERMQMRLDELRNEHRRLDQEIDAARMNGTVDMLKISRMKKIKLAMKDQIVWLENQVTPDIIA
jgi:hypothetical protein